MEHSRTKSLIPILKLMRLHQPIGNFLLLWPCLWALWLAAQGPPDFKILIIFITGVLVMRAAGCIINDIADRHFDGRVNRTQDRPLVQKNLSIKTALALFLGLMLAALTLVSLLNTLCIELALIAAALAILYPYMKRFTHWPQLVLGIAFSWSIPMAFAAVHHHVPPLAWYLLTAGVLWTLIYDTEYAMSDREDDLKIGLKSTAILFGRYDCQIIALLKLSLLLLLFAIGYSQHLHWPYYLSLALAALLALTQLKLIQHRQPQACLQAFLNHNTFGAFIFLGILLSYSLPSFS